MYNYRVKNDSIKVYQLKSNLLMIYNIYNVDVYNIRFIISNFNHYLNCFLIQ